MTDALAVDEGRRQAYLAALGIPLWSARVALPGALPSAPLDFVPHVAAAPDLAPDVATAPDPAVAEAAPARASLPPAPAAAPRAGLEPRPAAPAAGSPPAPRTAAADAAAPRLGCRAFSLAPGLAAVVDLGDAPDLAAAEYRLLDNIARALDAPELPAPRGEVLRWPLNRNPKLDHGPEAMRTWLGHVLRLPPGRCVVFGDVLAAHVAAALPGTVVIAAPALEELLAGAGAKRRLWQALHG